MLHQKESISIHQVAHLVFEARAKPPNIWLLKSPSALRGEELLKQEGVGYDDGLWHHCRPLYVAQHVCQAGSKKVQVQAMEQQQDILHNK